MNRRVWLILLAMSVVTAAPPETYYVATDGKPENDGSSARPWPSVEYAFSKTDGNHQYDNRPNHPKTISSCCHFLSCIKASS